LYHSHEKEAAMRIPTFGAHTERAIPGTNRPRQRGFTLIEVLCATAVTVIGLISAFYLVALSTTVNSDAKNVAQAYQVAQQEIELLRNMPFATLQLLIFPPTAAGTLETRFIKADGTPDASRPGDAGYPGLAPGLGNLRGGSGGLIISDDSTSGTPKHVTVVVRYTDPGNQQRSAIVGTIIAQGGMGAR
jgi:prepilin-type N-terminal cleavage/methylation domain-containing protein